MVFTVDTDTPHFFPSSIASIALVEAILAQCVAIGDKEPLNSIRRYEQQMLKLGAYYDNK